MIEELIGAEIEEIEQTVKRFDEGYTPMGFAEMPCSVNLSLGIVACRMSVTEDDVDRLREMAFIAFLAGRSFGKLEAASSLLSIATAIPMSPTDYPSALYEMFPVLCGEGRLQ
jgi:hypothetical protein